MAMIAGTGILDRLLVLETVSEPADGSARVTVGGQGPPVVELDGAVARYSAAALGTAPAEVATDAFTRHDAATVDLFSNVGLVADPGLAGSPDVRRRAGLMTAVRVVVDSPDGLVTIERTGDRRVGASAALARRFRAIHPEPRRYRAVAVTGPV